MKSSSENSQLLEDKVKQVQPAKYTKEESDYRGELLVRMSTARNIRENRHDEFDGMTYYQYCEFNRKAANSYIEPKKNKQDTTLVTGVTRNKIMAYLALLNNQNFKPEVRAFNQEDIQDVELGNAFTDVVEKTDEMDKDDEKKIMRQYVLLEQGTVFVEEVWNEYYETYKEFDKDTKFNGRNFDKVKWTTRMRKISEGPSRNIIQNENVYLGDITQFDMQDQPFIFTIRQIPYELAKSLYGDWGRFKNVSMTAQYFDQPPVDTIYNGNWTLSELQKGYVEEVKYQDRFNNEYAIFLNSTLMTPVGLPMPRLWGERVEYNIEKQVLEYVPFFAYGKSLPQRAKSQQQIYDELNRLMVLKTQQSAAPPRGNLSGMQVSSRIYMPGKFTTGIDPKKLPALIEPSNLGMNKSELMMLQELQKQIDDSTVSPAMLGKNPAGTSRTTATQAQQMKQSADLMSQLTVFSATMLEIKLGRMRFYNVLENWMMPIGDDDNTRDKVDQQLENKYRKINLEKMLDIQGPGQSIVEVTETPEVDPVALLYREVQIEKQTGKPTRIRQVNPLAVKAGKWSFFVIVTPTQKKTSDLSKVLFNEMMNSAIEYFPETIQKDYLSTEFALVWGKNPLKMFGKPQQAPSGPGGAPGAGQTNIPGSRGSIMPKSMTQAGKPAKPSLNAMEQNQGVAT